MKKDITPNEIITLEKANKFSGNFLFSFYGFFSCCVVLILWKTGRQVPNTPVGAWLILTGIFMLFYWSISGETYYFFVSDRHLLVKNQLRPWVNHIYTLEQIKEVTFGSPARRSSYLRVITTDGREHRYNAGSLRSKTWSALIEKFRQYNIKIR